MKKIVKGLGLFLLAAVIALLVWTKLPLRDSGVTLAESAYFLFASINIEKADAGILDEIAAFKFKEKYALESRWARWALRFGGRFILPLEISIVAHPEAGDADRLDYLAVVKSPALRRLSQPAFFIYRLTPAFKRRFTSAAQGKWQFFEARKAENDIQVIGWYADTMIVSSHKSIAVNLIMNAGRKGNARPKSLFGLSVDNKEGFFSANINRIKDKASYNVFRSASDLKSISCVLFASKQAYSHRGVVAFDFYDADTAALRGDMRFFMQLLRRMFDANEYDFGYSIEEENNLITANYTLRKK